MKIAAFVAIVTVVLAGCGHDDEPQPPGSGPGGVPLAAEYVSVEVTERGEPRALVEGTQIRLSFDGDAIGASLGCNLLGGRYRVEGTTLVVEELSTTDMGCDPERHDQDAWFADLLTTGPQLLMSGDEIQLNDGVSRVVLRDAEVAEPDRPLVATVWEVDGFLDGETAMSAAAPDAPGRLVLERDNQVSAFDGCSEVTGLRWQVDGSELRIDGDPSDAQPCEGGDDHAERVRAVLGGTLTWSVDADRLTLLAGDGRGVTFRAAG
jgi:heat shock protein HslJ